MLYRIGFYMVTCVGLIRFVYWMKESVSLIELLRKSRS